jgi:hypoxia up-regulated 1
MQFTYMHTLAQDAVGECVHNVIVTIPVFYLQFECDVIADAVKLSSLHLLMLINNGAAVAVN